MIILGFAGSLRKNSFNRALLREALNQQPENMQLDIFDLDDIPLYNDDLAMLQSPSAVQSLREKIRFADGLLIASTEYNYSISGVLKNAIDWASTNTLGNVLDQKIVAIMGASNGNFGTTRAQLHLRQVLHAVNARPLSRPEVLVRLAQEHFDDEGSLTNAYTRKKIGQLLMELKQTVQTQETIPGKPI